LRVVFQGEAAETFDPCEPLDDCVRGVTGHTAAGTLQLRIGQDEVVAPDATRLQRLFDVAVAAILLLACAPLFLLFAVLSKLVQPGPVFYRQERVGRNGKPFRMLKFRSMRVDAERITGPVFAVSNDPRCTRLGGWLRRSCCDELPQLLNVLRGEMSLVGPRPERTFFVEQFRQCIPHYDERHSVRPGITGWAQINGWRGDTRIKERLLFDLEYVRRRSLLFDLQILLRTPGAILSPKRVDFGEEATVAVPVQSGPPAIDVGTSSRIEVVRIEPVVRRAA
jgi:exopolysaccharide biosynthesis polyprenyl glycosylphosphotransferase